MKNPIAKLLRSSPEAEIERVRGRHADLLKRLEALTIAAADAAARQRALLIESDVIDEAALAKAEAACRSADDRKAATEAAIREITQRLADMEAAHAAEQERAIRAKVAAEIRARNKEAEKLFADLDRLAEPFGDQCLKVLRFCEAKMPRDPQTGASIGPNIARGAGCLAKVIAHTEHDKTQGVPESAIGAAMAGMAAMEALAVAIEQGHAPAVLPAPPEAHIPVTIALASVVLSRPIWYHGHLNQPTQVCAGGVQLPAPVAARAREEGIAFDVDSRDGKQIRAAVEKYGAFTFFKRHDGSWMQDIELDPETNEPASRTGIFHHVDVRMFDWEQAERARLRAAA